MCVCITLLEQLPTAFFLRGIVITAYSSCAEATDQKPAAERVWKEMLPS